MPSRALAGLVAALALVRCAPWMPAAYCDEQTPCLAQYRCDLVRHYCQAQDAGRTDGLVGVEAGPSDAVVGDQRSDGAVLDTTPADRVLDATAATDGAVTDATLGCPASSVRCASNRVEVCDGTNWQFRENCSWGCHTNEPRCLTPEFSAGLDWSWLRDATTRLAPVVNALIDTDSGTLDGRSLGADFHIVAGGICGSSSATVGVFVFSDVAIPAGVTVRIIGSRSAAIVARETIAISGLLDASGGQAACNSGYAWCAGPGGFAGGHANNPGETGSGPGGGTGGIGFAAVGDEMGGGGGGHGGRGGNGGSDLVENEPGGIGGGSYNGSATLCGGSGGGGGGSGINWMPDETTGIGGGGGGALLLASAASVVVSGAGAGINAGGGGGTCDKSWEYDDGGGGGGAGGTIVVEAPRIAITGTAVLAANGGGGGGGYNAGQQSTDGASGQLGATSAGAGVNGGAGGAGAQSDGAAGADFDDGGGGGGGAVGRIHLRYMSDQLDENGGTTSPPRTTTVLGVH